MKLRDIDFGSVFCAAGAQGFFGEGYPFHDVMRLFGMTWAGTTFTTKTITYPPRTGNMPLKLDGITPVDWLPRSVVVKPLSGHVLNAISLSGPGAEWAFATKRWQKRTQPFVISYMSAAPTKEQRLREARQFADLFRKYKPSFNAQMALKLNQACPNTGHPPTELYEETGELLGIFGMLGVPVIVNFNPVTPLAFLLAHASAVDALWIGNTIPWGDPRIDWQKIFGTTVSPLAKRGLPVPGGGGLSGPACLQHSLARVTELRMAGVRTPIIVGNGIQRPGDVYGAAKAGANAIAIGVVGMVRPWRMSSIISTAHRVFT